MADFTPAFDNMVDAINWLQAEGYENDFNLDDDCILYGDNAQKLYPDDFEIDYVFRFEGETDPGDENIVYGIRSQSAGLKGTLISAFGVYADGLSQQMIAKLSFAPRN